MIRPETNKTKRRKALHKKSIALLKELLNEYRSDGLEQIMLVGIDKVKEVKGYCSTYKKQW